MDRDALLVGKYIGEGRLTSFLETHTKYNGESKNKTEEIYQLLLNDKFIPIGSNEEDKERELRDEIISEIKTAIKDYEVIISYPEREILKQIYEALNYPTEISIDIIKQIVSNVTKISVEELDIKTRKREVAQARQIAMYFSNIFTAESLGIIGNNIGSKDHATVLHSRRTINNLIAAKDKKIGDLVYGTYKKLVAVCNIRLEMIEDKEIRRNLGNLIAYKKDKEMKEKMSHLSLGDKLEIEYKRDIETNK